MGRLPKLLMLAAHFAALTLAGSLAQADLTVSLYSSTHQKSATFDSDIHALAQTRGPFPERTFLEFGRRKIEVSDFLGMVGPAAMFLRVDNRKALRVPVRDGDVWTDEYFNLRESRGVPEMDEEESMPPEYSTIDHVDAKFDVNEFFNQRMRILWSGKLSRTGSAKVERQFYRFVQKLAHYSQIGGLRPENVVYDGTRWVLIDFTAGTLPATQIDGPNPFESETMKPYFSDAVSSKIREAVRTARFFSAIFGTPYDIFVRAI